jgi:hypothetical protein
MKLSEFKKQIRKNIIDILSEGPAEDTAAKDAEKKAIDAKLKALQAQKASLSKPQSDPTLEEAEVEEGRQLDTGKMVSVADKEALEMFREKAKQKADRIPKFGWLVKMVDMIIDAGNNGTTEKKLADDLKKAGQSAINPVIRKLLELGAVKRTGTAPSEPKEKEPKEKMFKPKSAALPKDDAPEDVKDTYYNVDADDIGFDDEKEPSKADISKNAGSKFSSTGDKYKALLKQMKDIADKYKAASGEEAKAYVDQLKDLTKEKKKLEAILNPSIGDEDEEF